MRVRTARWCVCVRVCALHGSGVRTDGTGDLRRQSAALYYTLFDAACAKCLITYTYIYISSALLGNTCSSAGSCRIANFCWRVFSPVFSSMIGPGLLFPDSAVIRFGNFTETFFRSRILYNKPLPKRFITATSQLRMCRVRFFRRVEAYFGTFLRLSAPICLFRKFIGQF